VTKENSNDNKIIPKDITSKLLSIILIAIGNVLIIVGENLIEKGKGNLNLDRYSDDFLSDNK